MDGAGLRHVFVTEKSPGFEQEKLENYEKTSLSQSTSQWLILNFIVLSLANQKHFHKENS